MRVTFAAFLILLLSISLLVPAPALAHSGAKYVILMIGDGQGANQIQATNLYTGAKPAYQDWAGYWMTTYPEGGSYDPSKAWTDLEYVKSGTTDSAAAASALYSGTRTANGRMSVTADGKDRLYTIAEKAHSLGKGAGAVSSVYISHATPGAWFSHNDSRGNGFAIADEALWGDPNTTGSPQEEPLYAGGHGTTLPAAEVLIGAGHPYWGGGNYLNQAIRDKLVVENGKPGAFTFVERIAGSPDGGARLFNAASDPSATRLMGLFGGSEGNLEYRLADGSGQNPENPTLAEMTQAALTVLERNPSGFVLMVEGGAIDWASHLNNMNKTIGEVIGFNEAVQAVIDWVDDPGNDSTWDNTLVIVTADHETGYLTAAPGADASQSLGEVSLYTLSLEKTMAGSYRRASWEDADLDRVIDPGEQVYWAWNSSGHTNSLVPLFAKGAGADLFSAYATGSDPVRGAYLDNTNVFDVMNAAIDAYDPTPAPGLLPEGSKLYLPFVVAPQPSYEGR